ncbi:MAG: hypothetical protein HY862_16170 [Chloroflexi bacterium]|nr:hypothetical protein [Chloroflexota bacterium]
MTKPIGTSLRLAIMLTTFIGTLLTVSDLMPTPLKGAYVVEASCAAIQGASIYQQNGDEKIESFTIHLTLPDGTPLAGVCLTFTRDRGPGEPPEIVAQCTTDAEGSCTVNIPGGVITVNFGNTKIGGIQVDSSQSNNTTSLNDASSGGLTYYFPADEPADEPVVATPGDGGTITVDHATTDDDGNLQPLPGDPTTEWPDIPPDFDGGVTGGVDPFPFGDLLPLPEGIVTVRFTPTILQTAEAYDHAYCYYATRAGGYARAPSDSGSFLPGGGQYFDLGAALSGDSRPAQILIAEQQSFDMVVQCWGWQGSELKEIGTNTLTQTRDQWRGQALNLSGSGFGLSYSLPYDNPDRQPQSPRLPNIAVLTDLSAITDLPDTANLGGVVAVPRSRFTDEIFAPTNLRLVSNQLDWDYDGENPIGGFRVYRNGYLIGMTPPDARGWTGDGLSIAECGEATEFTVTTYSGGQESVPSNTVSNTPSDCAAQVTITFGQLGLSNVNDCDGESCGKSPEIYGYFLVNDAAVFFGGASSSPQYAKLKEGAEFDFNQILMPFGKTNQLTVGVSNDEGLTIEVALFDHDAETSDDILCSWQENLPPRDSAGWQSQNGRVISRDGVAGEAACNFNVTLSVE